MISTTLHRMCAVALVLTASPAVRADEVSKEVCIDSHSRGQDAREQNKLTLAKKLFLTCAQPSCPALVQGELEFAAPPLATERQVEFLYQLARQIRGLGGQRLMLVAEHRYGRSLNELTASEASGLIDLLKEVRAGTRPIAEVLPEAAA